MRINVNVIGVKQAQAYILSKHLETKARVESGLKQAGRLLQNEVKLSIAGHRSEPRSVDTGRFLNSIDTEMSNFSISIFTPLDYPIKLEYGTSKFKARRHFHNSLDRNRDAVETIVKESVKGL
jgi:hypothetical protein